MAKFHVRDNFAAGAPISQVPASWFNKVARFLNNFRSGEGCRVNADENGPVFSVLPSVDGPETIGTAKEIPGGAHADREGQYTIPNGADDTEWLRGETSQGVKIKVYTMLSLYQGCIYGIFRELTFDKDGRLRKVGPEKFGDYMMGGY